MVIKAVSASPAIWPPRDSRPRPSPPGRSGSICPSPTGSRRWSQGIEEGGRRRRWVHSAQSL
ncbi:hypothetical protein TIFTF001_043429 [Ficus carica]|uniref:Uncharacterized protein n=1 Tax=Ficus carica TaxID=3494 RepID=A0AA88CM88_FICCA|nr:hypothetical protein TIFTF001_043428 [Ficus carica]GMN21968.1 hypothetical protein TIFTF001_043429 [Ficus carica]